MQKYLEQLKVVLAVAQKHLLSVICGVVAILAVVACFWPTTNFYDGLQQNVQTSLSAIQQIRNLQNTSRSLPVMDPGRPALPLQYFPNRRVVDWGSGEMDYLDSQSQKMRTDAISLNDHIPLYRPAFFSGPADHRVEGTSEARTEFARMYLDATQANGNSPGDQRIRNWPAADVQATRPRDEQIPQLKAGVAPSDVDVQAAQAALQQKINAATLQTLPNGQVSPESQQLATEEYNDQSRVVMLHLATKAAEACKVYLEPGALKEPAGVATFSGTTQAPNSQDIWDAQRWLWVDEDVATGVAYANAGAANVTVAPVKQIVDVEFPTPYVFVAPTDQSSINDTGQVPLMFDQSSTGHVSNGMYDVIHFTLVLDVDAGSIPDVLWNIQKGQFITVMDYHVKTVDSAALLLNSAGHFDYGSAPVVELTMDCEELMLKGWVGDLQPPVIAAATPPQQ